jgi:serine/threonine protein kinase
MEFLSGGEVFDAICDKQFYQEEDARLVMKNIADAICYMHDRNVIHRDLKPENLVLTDKTPKAFVKIIDFGFARVVGGGRENPSDLRGTALYVAPEMIALELYDKSVDIWSMGCNLFILLSGVVPFESKTTNELYPKITVSHVIIITTIIIVIIIST